GKFKMTGGTITVTGNGQGVYVMDGGSVVTLDGVKITGSGRGGSYGVEVEGGTFEMTGGTIEGGGGYGVYMGDGTVTLNTVKISGSGSYGVYMGDGTMRLEGTRITGFGTGVNVGGGTFEMTGGSIEGNGRDGVGVSVTGGNVTLERVKISQFAMGVMAGSGSLMMIGGTITGLGSGQGVVGSGRMRLTDVTMTGFTTGVSAGDNLTMIGGSITGNGKGGYGVKGGGTMRLERVEIEGFGTGVSAGSGSLTMTGGSVTEFTEKGVDVGSGVKSAELTGTVITGSGSVGSYGVYAVGTKDMTMTLTDVTISKVKTGVEVKRGKSLTIRAGTITGLGRGGVGVSMTGGTVTLEGGVTITGFTTGVSAGDNLTMIGGSITGNGRGGYGVYAVGTVRLERVKISQFAMGVSAGESLTMTDVRIEGSGGVGSYGVTGGGTVRLERVEISKVKTGVNAGGNLTMTGGSTISFMGDYGVMVGDKVESVSLTKTVIKGGGKGSTGVSVLGTKDMTMTLTDVTVEGVERGVRVEKGKSLTMKDGTITGKGSGGYGVMGSGRMRLEGVRISEVGMGVYVKNGKSLTIRGNSTISLASGGRYGVGVYVGDGVESVSLTKTVIKGKGSGSMGVSVLGTKDMTMTLEGVKISKVETGVVVVAGENLTIGGSSRIEFTDGYGVMVGSGVKRAELTGTRITGGRKGYGVYAVGGENLVMRLENVTVSEVGTGVKVEKGKKLVISGSSRIEFMGDYGVYMGDGVKSAEL
ncbi:hypothetical protein GGR10_001415, partial [Bartonella chomelii]